MKASTKKIARGIYQHQPSRLFISVCYGTSEAVWNIFSDKDLREEFAIGFSTKKTAIDALENYLESKTKTK